jgi:hypothetical protein
MPHLILYSHGVEFDRRPLTATPVVVGRGTDCELSVHDILLSRRHFRLTPTTDGWLMIDLRSRNGTLVNGNIVEQQILKPNDVIRAGKTAFRFMPGAVQVTPARPATPPPVPVASPSESTAFGLVIARPKVRIPASPVSPAFRMASPKPRPRDPDSFADTGVYALLDQIVSSSWDSTYALNARPLPRALPRAAVTTARDQKPHEAPADANDTAVHRADFTMLPVATVVLQRTPRRFRTRIRLAPLRRWVRHLARVRLF